MDRTFFLTTDRIGFSEWSENDLPLAELLWGDPEVTRYICAAGRFTKDEIANRLRSERVNGNLHQVQYWPVFALASHELMGCCGLRPHEAKAYELGFHLRPAFWGRGYAEEAANAVIHYAFTLLGAKKLFAGHHPDNARSRKLLHKLGFAYTGDSFYAPTGLYHPSYTLEP